MARLQAGSASAPVLEISNLQYTVRDRMLIKNLELTVKSGESVAVMGASGAGKSTLLSLILGLAKPSAGSIRVSGNEITSLSRARLTALRSRTIGAIFQFGELIPELSPLDNVALAALLLRRNRQDSYAQAEKLLAEMGVPRAEMVEELSGGERQRTAVARALINSPQLVLADEPTGSLDPEARNKTAELLLELPRSRSCSLLLVTHDPEVAAMADKLYRLDGGVLMPVAMRKGEA